MSLDYSHTAFSRLYHQAPYEFRQLPLLSKGFGYYLKTIVDPVHGWLRLSEPSMIQAVRNASTGPVPRGHQKTILDAIKDLIRVEYLARCTIVGQDLGAFSETPGFVVPLSGWREDPDGSAFVIVDWVPSEHGLNEVETAEWHAMRLQRVQPPVALWRDRRDGATPADARDDEAAAS